MYSNFDGIIKTNYDISKNYISIEQEQKIIAIPSEAHSSKKKKKYFKEFKIK